MNIELKEHYKGQLAVRYNHVEQHFEYSLIYAAQHLVAGLQPEVLHLKDGDELTIRNPVDGNIILKTTIDLDREAELRLNVLNNKFQQFIGNQPVEGIQKGVEPYFWVNLFNNGYYADVIRYLED